MNAEKKRTAFWNHSLVWASVVFLGFAIYYEAGLRKQRVSWPDDEQSAVAASAKKLTSEGHSQRGRLSAQTRKQLNSQKSFSKQKAEAVKEEKNKFLRRNLSKGVQTDEKIHISKEASQEALKERLALVKQIHNDDLEEGETALTEEKVLEDHENQVVTY